MSNLPLMTEDAAQYIAGPHICCLCSKEFTGWGNNPEPLKPYEERCCNECNNDLVIPWRIQFGRDTEPLWLTYGYGKCAFERVLCAHPFHEMEEFVDQLVTDTSEVQTNIPLDTMLGVPSKVPELANRAWFGKPPKEEDLIGQAVEEVLGKTKEFYGGVPVK